MESGTPSGFTNSSWMPVDRNQETAAEVTAA
jgi:hypothetical protein